MCCCSWYLSLFNDKMKKLDGFIYLLFIFFIQITSSLQGKFPLLVIVNLFEFRNVLCSEKKYFSMYYTYKELGSIIEKECILILLFKQ